MNGKIFKVAKIVYLFSFSFLSTILSPILVLQQISELNEEICLTCDYNSYLVSVTQNTLLLVIIGVVIIIFNILFILQRPYSPRRTIFAIFIELLYGLHIIIWSRSTDIYLTSYFTEFYVSFSKMFLLTLGIPIILIIRNIIQFYFRKEKIRHTLAILYSLNELGEVKEKNRIKKHFSKFYNPYYKKSLLKEFDSTFDGLLNGNDPLIIKNNKNYYISRKGITLLQNFNEKIIKNKI